MDSEDATFDVKESSYQTPLRSALGINLPSSSVRRPDGVTAEDLMEAVKRWAYQASETAATTEFVQTKFTRVADLHQALGQILVNLDAKLKALSLAVEACAKDTAESSAAALDRDRQSSAAIHALSLTLNTRTDSAHREKRQHTLTTKPNAAHYYTPFRVTGTATSTLKRYIAWRAGVERYFWACKNNNPTPHDVIMCIDAKSSLQKELVGDQTLATAQDIFAYIEAEHISSCDIGDIRDFLSDIFNVARARSDFPDLVWELAKNWRFCSELRLKRGIQFMDNFVSHLSTIVRRHFPADSIVTSSATRALGDADASAEPEAIARAFLARIKSEVRDHWWQKLSWVGLKVVSYSDKPAAPKQQPKKAKASKPTCRVCGKHPPTPLQDCVVAKKFADSGLCWRCGEPHAPTKCGHRRKAKAIPWDKYNEHIGKKIHSKRETSSQERGGPCLNNSW